MDHDLIRRARVYATEMHERINQRRKYTQAPYAVHLKSVADLVATVSGDPEMIAAAWLHDTVEDTPATFEDLEREFGDRVMQLVMQLTDVSRPGDGNRSVRKEIDRRHLAAASPGGKTIKLADIIDNTRDISRHDPRFARVYLPEMQLLLEVLTEGDDRLFRKARDIISDCARRLGVGLEKGALTAIPEEHESDEIADTFSQFSGLQIFTEKFTARSVFEPLLSCDAGVDRSTLEQIFGTRGASVVGIRQKGHLTGYLLRDDLPPRSMKVPPPRPFSTRQMVRLETPLTDLIHSLTHHAFCFVRLDGEVIGVVTRNDIEKPAARMWLFGLVMLIDLSAARSIREYWRDDSWTGHLSASRLAKARELHLERQRCSKAGDLLDCLQFSDKLQLLLHIDRFLERSGFASRSGAKQVFKDLESLRNNLAHGQEIAHADWPSIVRLARLLGATGNDGIRP